MFEIKRVWFSGRMVPCQGTDGSSILPTRTTVRVRRHVMPPWENRSPIEPSFLASQLGY